MKKISLYLVASIGITSSALYSMDEDVSKAPAPTNISECRIHAIPGWNRDAKHSAWYVEQTFPDHEDVQHIVIPPKRFDFAQRASINFVEKELEKKEASKPIITVATSLGASTILNLIGEQSQEELHPNPYRPAALILTAPFASGNSGILHLLEGPKEKQIDPTVGPLLKRLPGSHDWLPFLAKFVHYWSYDPAGIQPIKSLENFPKDQLVIFAHYKNDPQVSVNDAKAMYYLLGSRGHMRQKLYMILKEGNGHGNVLRDAERPIINSILRAHGLISSDSIHEGVDLAAYQPHYKEYEEYYNKLIAQERRYEKLQTPMYVGAAAAVGVIASSAAYAVMQ